MSTQRNPTLPAAAKLALGMASAYQSGTLSKAARRAAAAGAAAGLYAVTPSLRRSKQQLRTSGDGRTIAPTAIGTRIMTGSGGQSRLGKSVRIKNRELIVGSVLSSTNYTVQHTIPLNPGLATSFPWLSKQANQYEMYRFVSLSFHYVPSVPTSTAGDVLFGIDYNATDDIPATEVQFMDLKGSTMNSVWQSSTTRAAVTDMHALGPRKYVRTMLVPGDIKTFDCGNLFVASVNTPVVAAAGKLFVEYDVELFTPKLDLNISPVSRTMSQLYSAGSQSVLSGTTTAVILDTTSYDPLRFATTYASGVFTPPAGCYHIVAVTRSSVSSAGIEVNLSLWKNNAPANTRFDTDNYSSAVAYVESTAEEVISFNGTDTFSVRTTVTGASPFVQAAYLLINVV